MRSLLSDLAHPAVDAFMDAVDEVMNSNTFLLKVGADVALTPDNRVTMLSSYLRGSLFSTMMLAADRARNWWMFQDLDLVPDGEREPASVEQADESNWPLLVDNRSLTVTTISAAAFVARLQWMLREAFSPYHRHLDHPHTDTILGGLLGQLFDAHAQPEDAAGPPLPGDGWTFCDLRPDFLHNTGYYTGGPCPDLAYFDGGGNDTATFFYRDDVFYLLLTNGSP